MRRDSTIIVTDARGEDRVNAQSNGAGGLKSQNQADLGGAIRGQIIEKMAENLLVNLAYLDRDGTYLYVNRCFASSLGKTTADFIGLNAFALNPDNSEGRAMFERVLQTGRAISAYSLPYTNPERPELGTSYWDWTLQPITEADGSISGVIFTSTDATHRRTSEKALQDTQALFELLFESAPDANILTDEQGLIVALNYQAEKMFGYQRYELVGKPITLLLPERFPTVSQNDRMNDHSKPHARHGVRTNRPVFAVTRDGREVPVGVMRSPLHTENGLRILSVVRDMSEALQAEADLRKSEARFHAIFDNAAVGIKLLDARGNIEMTNPLMQRMLGYTEDELRGMNFMQFTYEDDLQQYMNNFQALLDGKIARYRMEKRYRRKDGTIFWGRLNVSRYDEQRGQGPLVIVMVEDINELKSAEAALRSSEQNFRTSLETLVDGFAILSAVRDADGQITDFRFEYINQAGSRLNNLPREKHIGHTVQEILPPYSKSGIFERFKTLVEENTPLEFDALEVDGNGEDGIPARRIYDLHAVPMEDGMAVSWRDITGRKAAELALQAQEALLRTVIDTLPVGVWITDRDGRIQFGNLAGQAIWGSARAVGANANRERTGWWAQTGERIHPEAWAISRAVQHGEISIEEEVVIQTHDGKFKTILNSAAPIRDAAGNVTGAIIVDQDITERKQMQAELAEVQHKLLRNAEEERLHLARELHDGPIQDLYGLTFQIDELRDHLQQESDVELVTSARANLQQTITTLRSIMSELRPPTLAPFGLEKTIRSHAEHFQQQHPEIRLHIDLMRDGQALPEPVRLALYRIYQEALNNILRHAHAKNIQVHFNYDDKSAGLIIQDDGVGFEVPHHWVHLARSGHYGLVGMRERVEALGGRLEIESRPGQGTIYHASVPLHAG